MSLLKMPLADFLSNKFDRDFEYLISMLDDLVIRTAISKMLKGLIKSNSVSLRATHLREIFELKDDFANIVDNPRQTRAWGNRSVANYMNGFRDTDFRYPNLHCLCYLGGFVKKTTRRHENYFPIEFVQIQLNDETARRCAHRWGPQENYGRQAPNRTLRPRPQPGPQYHSRKTRGPQENGRKNSTKPTGSTRATESRNTRESTPPKLARPNELSRAVGGAMPRTKPFLHDKIESIPSSTRENKVPDDGEKEELRIEIPPAPLDLYRLTQQVKEYSELAPFKIKVGGHRVVYDFRKADSFTLHQDQKSLGAQDLGEGTSATQNCQSPLLLYISDSSAELYGWDSDESDN